MRRFAALGTMAIAAAALVLGLAAESSAAPAPAAARATVVRVPPVAPSVTTLALANRATAASMRNGGAAFVSGVLVLPASATSQGSAGSTVLGLSWTGPDGSAYVNERVVGTQATAWHFVAVVNATEPAPMRVLSWFT